MGVHYELSEEERFYRNALTRMPDGPAALEEAYNAVEDIVGEVEQYVKVGVIDQDPFTVCNLKELMESNSTPCLIFLCGIYPGVAAVPVPVGHAG